MKNKFKVGDRVIHRDKKIEFVITGVHGSVISVRELCSRQYRVDEFSHAD